MDEKILLVISCSILSCHSNLPVHVIMRLLYNMFQVSVTCAYSGSNPVPLYCLSLSLFTGKSFKAVMSVAVKHIPMSP